MVKVVVVGCMCGVCDVMWMVSGLILVLCVIRDGVVEVMVLSEFLRIVWLGLRLMVRFRLKCLLIVLCMVIRLVGLVLVVFIVVVCKVVRLSVLLMLKVLVVDVVGSLLML